MRPASRPPPPPTTVAAGAGAPPPQHTTHTVACTTTPQRSYKQKKREREREGNIFQNHLPPLPSPSPLSHASGTNVSAADRGGGTLVLLNLCMTFQEVSLGGVGVFLGGRLGKKNVATKKSISRGSIRQDIHQHGYSSPHTRPFMASVLMHCQDGGGPWDFDLQHTQPWEWLHEEVGFLWTPSGPAQHVAALTACVDGGRGRGWGGGGE